MARKKKDEVKAPSKEKDLLLRVRERLKIMTEADDDNRRQAMEDMKFVNVPGSQWDDNMKKDRGNRPCYEFNKLRITSKRIINDMRSNRSKGKVRAVEDSDTKTAEINEGLIRNIWNVSDGDTVIDYAAEYQVNGGMGAWRISTKYSDDTAFEQDIILEAIPNPLCLYADPSSQDILKRDADDWILTERISKKSYEAKWPKAERTDFDDVEFDNQDDWIEDDQVRICEYWYKEPFTKEIWQLQDGRVVDKNESIPPELVVKKRIVQSQKIMMCIASGKAILEGPTEWAGSQFPFIMVYGEYFIIDGKRHWYGLPRFAKDAQRSYNVSRTAITETIAQAPQAKWWVTPTQAKGNSESWAEAHVKNFPFLLFNPDPQNPGAPQKMQGTDVPMALIHESQLASEEIKAVTGIYDASLGNKSNEQSGRAIYARQQQGEIATFNYQDNMSKGIKRTWEILIDLVPKIYDTERTVRILGSDGADNFIKINTIGADQEGNPIRINDLSAGKYDVSVTIGPSFGTRRQEAAETYMELTQRNPEIFQIAGDLIFKSMDLPYAEEISERLKILLPEPVQKIINAGKDLPPEAKAAMAQAEQAMQFANMQMQQVQQAAQELGKEKSEVDVGKANIEKLIANLKTEEARFEAKVAQEIAKVEQAQAKIKGMEADSERAQDRAVLGDVMSQAANAIYDLSAQFTRQALNVMADIGSRPPAQAPKVVKVETRREGGNMVAIPVYDNNPSEIQSTVDSGPLWDEISTAVSELKEVAKEAKESKIIRIETRRDNNGNLAAIPIYE